jgi:hypothetical protein
LQTARHDTFFALSKSAFEKGAPKGAPAKLFFLRFGFARAVHGAVLAAAAATAPRLSRPAVSDVLEHDQTDDHGDRQDGDGGS